MKLPLLISVPHGGTDIPEELKEWNLLAEKEIIRDGDEGACEIYDIKDHVEAFVTTDIARAFVDLNRAPDDIRKDGVVKTHTCWEVPIYSKPLSSEMIAKLIDKYHRPYHEQLARVFGENLLLGIDCHTMAAVGPPVGPDEGKKRPMVCLSNADGTCPGPWIERMAGCFSKEFDGDIQINKPFQGGYTIRYHSQKRPWVQLELSRASIYSNLQKQERVLSALNHFVEWLKENK